MHFARPIAGEEPGKSGPKRAFPNNVQAGSVQKIEIGPQDLTSNPKKDKKAGVLCY
jgi:hypothetical protein